MTTTDATTKKVIVSFALLSFNTLQLKPKKWITGEI